VPSDPVVLMRAKMKELGYFDKLEQRYVELSGNPPTQESVDFIETTVAELTILRCLCEKAGSREETTKEERK